MTITPLDEKPSSKQKDNDPPLTSIKLGIWNVILPEDLPFDLRKRWSDLYSTIPVLRRLASEMHNVAPLLFVICISAKFWTGINSALNMYLSSRILRIVEIGLVEGKVDATAIVSAVVARLACAMFSACLDWWSDRAKLTLSGRVTRHFSTHLMHAQIRVDLPTSQDPSSQRDVSARGAWWEVESIVDYLTTILTMLSQLLLIIHESNNVGGPIFALLCIMRPLVATVVGRSLWNKAFIATPGSLHYQRKKALEELATGQYKQDILSGNLGEYILEEYRIACEKLGDEPDDHPITLYSMLPTPKWDVVKEVLADLPMMYCALMVITNPSKFSLASIAILNQSADWLGYSFGALLRRAENFRKDVNSIKTLYAAADIPNKMKEGELAYCAASDLGMGFELQNITFAYPGSKKTTSALDNLSLSIKPGQLVVIVGANGSGKSTIVKLLSRLYEPSSGTMLIDGKPVEQYRFAELRQATAILSQDNCIYPLSLGENIGLGYPEMAFDIEKIRCAAEQGGASQFIAKLEEGLKTTLDPLTNIIQRNFGDIPDHPLHEELKKVDKKLEISGGEKQRVVAARTFMRFYSGKVKFVAVDEPTSALDAEGELQLFENLIKARAGKTMVFVTHKFGHLTRHADMIVCMKDGVIAEQGTHNELLKVDGEYSKLYNIQVNAFTADSVKEKECPRVPAPVHH